MVQAIHTWFQTLDYSLLRSAVDLTHSSDFMSSFVYAAAELLIFILPLVLIVLWERTEFRTHKHGSRKAALLAVMSLVAALAVKALVNAAVFRNRPFVAHPDLAAMNFNLHDGSFPSAHSLISFSIAYSLVLSGYKGLGWTCMVIATLVALGRVFAGVHYPSDVIAGALIGMACALYFHREASSLKRYLPNQ